MNEPDKSNGYEEIAPTFIYGRNTSDVGASLVEGWSRMLAPGATVLDLGCGSGVPISQTLIENGFKVYGIDASPTLAASFRARFPGVPMECDAVEESCFFERIFEGVVAWGLFFLLEAEAQRNLIGKVSTALVPGGKFLFTAPSQNCSWRDNLTGRMSTSLGLDQYRTVLEVAGFTLLGTRRDEGENHYYLAEKR